MKDVLVNVGNMTVKDIGKIGAAVNRKLVALAADVPEKVLGGSRPMVDPGRPIAGLDGDVGQLIAAGFGLEVERVQAAIKTGDFSILENVAVPIRMNVEVTPQGLGHLSLELDSMLEQLTNDSLPAGTSGGTAPQGAPARTRARGAKPSATPAPERGEAEQRGARTLQSLLREAARRAKQEDER